MTPFQLAVLHLKRRLIPTVVALLSISVAVACSGLLLKLHILSNSRFSSLAQGGEAIVGAKASGLDILLGSLNLEGAYPGFLPMKLFESLRAQSQVRFEDGAQVQSDFVEMAIPFVYAGQVDGLRVVGTDESFLKRPARVSPVTLAHGQWFRESHEVVLGAQVALKLGVSVGGTVPVTPWTRGEKPVSEAKLEFRVSGILERTQSAWDRALFISLSDAQAILSQADLGDQSIWRADVLNYFLIYLRPGGFLPLEALINKRSVGQAVSVDEQVARLRELTGAGESLGFLISAFVMLLGGLSVAGVMLTRFEGMTTQVAVLRAIGYGRKELRLWLLWEGLLLGASACLMGGLIDAACFPVVRSLLGTTLPQESEIGVLASFPVGVIALVATVGAVCLPMMRMSRDVHSQLRGV